MITLGKIQGTAFICLAYFFVLVTRNASVREQIHTDKGNACNPPHSNGLSRDGIFR
jgi:hypothetical protein